MAKQEKNEAPVKPKVQEEVIFWSINENYRIGAESLQAEERNSISGRVMIPSGVIVFYKNFHKTSNPNEIAFLKALHDFELGRVKIVSPGEYEHLMKSKADVTRMTVSDVQEVAEG